MCWKYVCYLLSRGFKCSGKWYCVRWAVSDVPKDYSIPAMRIKWSTAWPRRLRHHDIRNRSPDTVLHSWRLESSAALLWESRIWQLFVLHFHKSCRPTTKWHNWFVYWLLWDWAEINLVGRDIVQFCRQVPTFRGCLCLSTNPLYVTLLKALVMMVTILSIWYPTVWVKLFLPTCVSSPALWMFAGDRRCQPHLWISQNTHAALLCSQTVPVSFWSSRKMHSERQVEPLAPRK
jgi:hypothetical protein